MIVLAFQERERKQAMEATTAVCGPQTIWGHVTQVSCLMSHVYIFGLTLLRMSEQKRTGGFLFYFFHFLKSNC